MAADFYLRTGYMPLTKATEQPYRSRVQFSDREIRALTAYIAGLGKGPAIPWQPEQLAAYSCEPCWTRGLLCWPGV